jgi:hypothetical protein
MRCILFLTANFQGGDMKKAICFAMSLALFTTSAFADSTALAPGKPAGVRKAQTWDLDTTMIIALLALAGTGIAIAASAGNAGGPTAFTSPSSSTTTTTTTGTST